MPEQGKYYTTNIGEFKCLSGILDVSGTVSYITANVSIFIFYMKPPCHNKVHH